jgi:hypothetical protein
MSAITLLVSFGLVFACVCIVERILYALLFMFMGEKQQVNKEIHAGLVIGSVLNLISAFFSVGIGFAMRCASLVGAILFFYAILYSLTAFWYVLYEDYPQVLVYFTEFYSKRIGPFLHGYFFMPMDLLNLVIKVILPFYNSVVWIARGLLSKGLFPILWDLMEFLTDFGVAMLLLGQNLSMSLINFIYNLNCDDLSCIEKPAVFDLLTPMGNVRDIAVVTSKIGSGVCSVLTLPLDWILYPWIDAGFARALHSFINSGFHLVVHAPRAALKRCDNYGGAKKHTDVLMCTPDLAPAFDHAVSGLRDLGVVVDNWLGVGAAMARRSLTGLPDDCQNKMTNPQKFRMTGLLSNAQTVVGLTDWLMAASNGSHAYFWGQVTSDTAIRLWPETVDVRMGLAAVAFDESAEVEISGVTQGRRPSGRQTTSILGCRCLDTNEGIVVRCSILPLQGGATQTTHSFDVVFQDSTWAKRMECRAVEISVRSVRWPVRRYEGRSVPFATGYVEVPEIDCMSKGSCESIDATIWLVPRCDVLSPEQCSDVAVGTSCFPFCMAARVSGGRNGNPVFVNAETWRSGKQILMRDCALQSSDSSVDFRFVSSAGKVASVGLGETTLSGVSTTKLFVSGSGDGSFCQSAQKIASWIPTNTTSRADPRSVPAYVRRRGQPFAIAGDSILMEFLTPDGASTVEVDRLSGNQRDVYSLVPGWAGLPTVPKLMVPLQELSTSERSRVVVPFDFTATRVPSTASRNYIFYAVSPDLRIFEAYLEYCRDSSTLPRAQIMMLSSYSALRVYRVRAYCQESCESGDLTSQYTFDGFSDGKFSEAEFPQDCSRVYNASIDALEYVNEQNLAVTVQVADKTYNPITREGSNSSYVTYWLNPQTMKVKSGEMWTIEVPSSLTAGLCVLADGVPHLGSLGAELAISALHLFHAGSGALLYMPGMLSFWRGGAVCPLESRGHSVLASCGESFLNVEDFFDSLDAASAIFWGIPAWIADQLEQGKDVDYLPVSDLLRGVGVYGRGTMGISGLQGGIMSLLNTPIPEQMAVVYALIRQPGALAGAAKIGGAGSSMARYTAKVISLVSVKVAMKLVIDSQFNLNQFWRDMVSTLYDSRPMFKSVVTDRGTSACLGLEMIFGSGTPPARLVYHTCLSSVRIIDGIMDLFLLAFADAPMVKCVCKDSAGKSVSKYARENCIWKAPTSMQPTLLGMISASEGLIGGDSFLCPAVIAHTRKTLENSMAPYFSTVFSSLDALGDSLDYVLTGFDSDAGQCSNYRADPQVVVLMPEPVDYFRGCGATTYCKTKCVGTWNAFDEARSRYDATTLTSSRNLEKMVDSLFFPSVVADMIAPGQIVALVKPDSCGLWVCRSEDDDCLVAAALTEKELQVSYYCIPLNPSSVVYRSDASELPWASVAAHEASKISFLTHNGSSIVALIGAKIVLFQRGLDSKVVMDVEQILSLPLMGMYPLRILDFVTVGQKMLVSIAVRTNSDGVFKRDSSTIWFSPFDVIDVYTHQPDFFPLVVTSGTVKDLWKGYAVSEYPLTESAYSASASSVMLLLWPITTGATLRRATISWTQTSVTARLEPIQHGESLVARATMIPRKLILSKTLHEDMLNNQLTIYASAGNVYDWLRQLRLGGSGLLMTSASLSNAQPVTAYISVNTTCDGLDCRGCPDLTLRSLCASYQSCSIFRCIGTPVNLKRPLCGVGQTLKSLGNVGVTSVQGAWIMFVDIFMILLQLSTVKNLPGVDVSFPEDSFMGNICAAKDVSAEFFSILTSTVNSVLQRVQSALGVLNHFSSIDSSVNTVVSLSLSSITGFLHQMALGPIYALSVGHKIMMCQVSGFLAVAGTSGTRVNIQPARFSSTDAISGQCLTVGAEVDAQQTGDSQAVRGIVSRAAEVLTSAGEAGIMRRLEPYMHMVDGALTYLIGVVAKFADVLQTMDIQHCLLPDVTLKDSVRCACGDKPLSVVPERAREGLSDMAFWCTGMLSMVDGDNRMQVVWNPYTYEELQAKIGGNLDRYLAEASQSVTAVAPNDPIFEEQGISMFAVLTRCRQNYVNKQWDPAAYVRYDPALIEREIRGNVRVIKGNPSDQVGKCLLDSMNTGVGNGACLDGFLRSRNYNAMYWGYHMINQTVGSEKIDACLVFSGPAASTRVSDKRRQVFQDCLEGYGSKSACDLSGFVWSPASSNVVPVAVRHVVNSGNGTFMADAVERRLRFASDMVTEKILSLANYSNSQLQAALFSAEGDVIHQLMDCVFLGPYARMDHWPVPRCNENDREDCLVGPYWSRDRAGGKSRNVDVSNCDSSKQLPFTCGSPTRKAMIKAFVTNYLEEGAGGADMIAELIRAWLRDQLEDWYYESEKFSCNCKDCCIGYLPKKLASVSLQISTHGIMNSIENRLKRFYVDSLTSPVQWISELDSVSPGELSKYNWSNSAGSSHIKTLSAFHPLLPTQRYDDSEAASPSTTYNGPAIWQVCHAALKQVLFTMPVTNDGEIEKDKNDLPFYEGGGPEVIDAYVRKLVLHAKTSSPLFRHYQPRHHPSFSKMCNNSKLVSESSQRGTVKFSDYIVQGNTILNGSTFRPIAVMGYDTGALGHVWRGTNSGLNEHLGFLDREATEQWLRGSTNLTSSSEFLLRYGAGGLKVGNVPGFDVSDLGLPAGYTGDLDTVIREQWSERDRKHTIESAAIYGCEEHKQSSIVNLEDFVNSLFPMAQGIRESGIASYCLRFSLELAMLYAMELVPDFDVAKIITQKELAVSWRRKCGTQVQLVGLCSALDIYHYQQVQTVGCLYSWHLVKDPAIEMYLTPECLVKIGDFFYDPCQCKPEWCEQRDTTQMIRRSDLENDQCKLKFDPRKVVQAAELGWWGEDETDSAAIEWNAWLEDPVNLLDMAQLRTALYNDGQAVGNTPLNKHWATAEGFMNETGHFCDMIADYWPEQAHYPVGFHVTTPCHQEDTGYRSFDNVFALESDSDGNPRLVYLEDQTRDADFVDSHFGAGGICRSFNFAMEMYETNTMRVCTRLTDGEEIDIHVPRGNITRYDLGVPHCSESSKDLPWADSGYYDYYDAVFHSVGTVPNLPSRDANLYPESGDRYMFIGPRRDMTANGWGDRCQDFELPDCHKEGWGCPPGFVCTATGVCQHSSVECTQHSDCSSAKMCSGLGTCEVPTVSVENRLGEDISFRAHTTECSGESFSMRGASYWGYVPDLLEAHGMCSYRHWQEYLYTMDKCCSDQGLFVSGNPLSVNKNYCDIRASTCSVYKFSKEYDLNKWWNETDNAPTRLRMIPTTCDRDYERFKKAEQEMLSCVPDASRYLLLNVDGTYQKFTERDQLWRIYHNPSRTVSIHKMPFHNNPKTGFLTSRDVNNIKSCMSIKQCFSDVFTRNGRPSMLPNTAVPSPDRTVWEGQIYDPNDQFRCGVIGYYDKNKKKCVVDIKLFPIYYVLCKEESKIGLGYCQRSLKQNSVPARCDEVLYEYEPEYSIINDVNVPALNKFFNTFEKPSTLSEHLNLVNCVNYIYGVMSTSEFGSKGLYVPFTFTLYEIPFAWFYQCMIGSGIEIDMRMDKKIYACTFYKNRMNLRATSNVYSDFSSYIFSLRGGYVRSSFESNRAGQELLILKAWTDAVEHVRATLFQGSADDDLTYSKCYTELHWQLPSDNKYKRKMIEAYVRNTCANSLLNVYILRYNQAMAKQVNMQTAIYELVDLAGTRVTQKGSSLSNVLLTGLIKDFGTELLQKKTLLANIDVQNTPVRLDYSIPDATSVEFLTALTRWRQISGVLPNEVDEKLVDMPAVGVYKDVYVDVNGVFLQDEDTDWQSGANTRVKAWSVYAQGYFGCAYPDISLNGQLHTLRGNNSNVELEFDRYATALYNAVKIKYDLNMALLVESNQVGPILMNTLPFFEEEAGLGFGASFQFDLKNVANYMSNINPDIKTPVMCIAGTQQVDFNKCSDLNYAALKSHVFSKYRGDGGIVVPDRNQLNWDVDKRMMTAGAIFSFASVNRNLSKRFINRIFDEDTVCGSTSTLSSRDKLCYFEQENALLNRSVIAPWLGGGYNPFDKCDVKNLDLQSGNAEIIDSLCYYEPYCPKERGTSTVNNPYYLNMPSQQCSERDNERTINININSRFSYNLCKHRLDEDSICNHTQGMLGGFDGNPSEDYDVGGGLFALHEFLQEPEGSDRWLGNPLLAGGEAEYGFLKTNVGHIGGHKIGMRIESDGTLKISKIPLKTVQEKIRIENWDTTESKNWIPYLSQNLEVDEIEYEKASRDISFVLGIDSRGKPLLGWDCPLRRRAFYTGNVDNFKPQLPSGRRSKRMFFNVTGNKWAHPTQKRQDGSARFGMYKTTNGFCFCPISEEVWPGMCSVDVRIKNEHNCSLYNTVRALRGSSWAWSHTFRPRNRQNEFKTCNVQLDWPFVEGRLRDNATVGHMDVDDSMWSTASDVESRKCHVLDRAPDFAYAYISRRELKRSGYNTLDIGVCHTGRVQKRFVSSQRCVRINKGDKDATIRCVDNTGGATARASSKKPQDAYQSSLFYRRRCDKCTKTPSFVTRDGHYLPPETSFGLPYRVSTERVLAKDLREALCDGNRSRCNGMLNASAWRKGEFLVNLMQDPKKLFKTFVDRTELSRSYEPKSNTMPSDSHLWARPWVYCPDRESLRTSKGCNGSISKTTWRTNKVGSCYATILDGLKDKRDPFASTDICNMDSRLGELCVAIREAQSIVASANCIKIGDEKCSVQEFVYNPSTWETSNQAFVHQTVQEFYMRADECANRTDCVCEQDSALEILRRNNSYRLRECSAVSVMLFRNVLIQMRSLIYSICKITSLIIDISFNFLLSMSSESRDVATSRIIISWAKLKQESTVIIDKVSDMFFDMIFSTGSLGPYLKNNFISACGVINNAYVYAADIWCRLIVEQLPLFLGALRSIGGWFEVGFSVVNDVFTVILDDRLPDALMDLYQAGYREYFQSARYREKQAAYEERKEASLLNQKQGGKKKKSTGLIAPDNKFLTNLGQAREQRLKRTVLNSAANLLGALGKIGGAVDVAITAKQLYDQIQLAIEIKEMLKTWPTSFTLFDFDDFYLSIDGLVEFLNADFTCYSMSTEVPPLQCTLLNFTEPSSVDVDEIAPRASVCWAEAQQRQIGVSNLYACTATSTCCVDPLNCDGNSKGVRLCSECPLPPAGIRTYGCNTMIQRCQCGVESYDVTRCAAQRDCGPSASCSLLTSLDDISFGTLRSCTECATSPVCLMGNSQQFGQCSCLTSTDSKVDLCSVPVGTKVNPIASKLCGFARDTGGYYGWAELSLVLCANALSPVCAEVMTETGSLIYMSVATRLRSGQVSYSSRRLLSMDEGSDVFVRLPSALLPEDPADDVTPDIVHKMVTGSEWNHTSAPCSTLAAAYKMGKELGPVDESTLHSCVYWRTVARQLIEEHDLVALKQFDTFLLSSGDLSASIGQKGVLTELLNKPWVLVHAVMYSQWMKPLRAMIVASHEANVTSFIKRLSSNFKLMKSEKIKIDDQEYNILNDFFDENLKNESNHNRKLMGVFEDSRDRIRALPFYPFVRSSAMNLTFLTTVKVSGAEMWNTDAFSWKGIDFDKTCPIADSFASLIKHTFIVSKKYYTHLVQLNSAPIVRKRFSDILPRASRHNTSYTWGIERQTIFKTILDIAGINIKDVMTFLSDPCPQEECVVQNRWTASYIVESVLFCDLESVMLCTQHKNDLIMSAIFLVILYIFLALMCGYFGLSAISTIMFFAIPTLTIWYSLGVSPQCFPMIPTCLLDDALSAFKSLFPVKTSLPSLLVTNSSKLLSCSHLGFNSWEDPLTFAWCDLGFCNELDDTSFFWDLSHWKFKQMHLHVNGKNVDAYRVCASVTATYAVPVLLIVTTVLTVGAAAVLSLLSVISPITTLIWQVILFNHSE